MGSDFIQPLGDIAPMCEDKNGDYNEQDPVKIDYIRGREFIKSEDYGQAALHLHNALKGFEEKGDQVGVANASDRLGDVCLAKEEYAAAIEHFQRAAAICEGEDDSFSQVALNKKIAKAYVQQEKYAEAFELLYDILDHYHKLQNPQGVVTVLEEIAALYKAQGVKEKAADAYRTIAGIHANFKHTRIAKEFLARAEELEQ